MAFNLVQVKKIPSMVGPPYLSVYQSLQINLRHYLHQTTAVRIVLHMIVRTVGVSVEVGMNELLVKLGAATPSSSDCGYKCVFRAHLSEIN
jgi:hypothetical protein